MNLIPDRKVIAGGVGGVLAWLILMAASKAGIPISADVQAQLAGVIGWVLAWAVPPSTRDIITRLNNDLVAQAKADPTIPVTK